MTLLAMQNRIKLFKTRYAYAKSHQLFIIKNVYIQNFKVIRFSTITVHSDKNDITLGVDVHPNLRHHLHFQSDGLQFHDMVPLCLGVDFLCNGILSHTHPAKLNKF